MNKVFEWKKEQLIDIHVSEPVIDKTAVLRIASACLMKCLTYRYNAIRQARKDRARNRKCQKFTENSLASFRIEMRYIRKLESASKHLMPRGFRALDLGRLFAMRLDFLPFLECLETTFKGVVNHKSFHDQGKENFKLVKTNLLKDPDVQRAFDSCCAGICPDTSDSSSLAVYKSLVLKYVNTQCNEFLRVREALNEAASLKKLDKDSMLRDQLKVLESVGKKRTKLLNIR